MEEECLEITTVSNCVNQCKVCPQDVFRNAYHGCASMSLDNFKVTLRTVPKHVHITFAGFSEPFMNRECPQMIKYACDQGYSVTLFTTTVGLTPEGLATIKDCKFHEVILHLPDNRAYARIPTTQSYKDMLIAFMQTIGIDHYMSMDANCFTDNERAGNTIAGKEKQRHIKGSFYCARLAKPMLVMLPNCDVVICCMDYGLKHNFGNLLKQTYTEIIDSVQYKSVINNRFKQDGDTLCRSCTVPSSLPAHYLNKGYLTLASHVNKLKKYGFKTRT